MRRRTTTTTLQYYNILARNHQVDLFIIYFLNKGTRNRGKNLLFVVESCNHVNI
jgi:hypothetical protein